MHYLRFIPIGIFQKNVSRRHKACAYRCQLHIAYCQLVKWAQSLRRPYHEFCPTNWVDILSAFPGQPFQFPTRQALILIGEPVIFHFVEITGKQETSPILPKISPANSCFSRKSEIDWSPKLRWSCKTQ